MDYARPHETLEPEEREIGVIDAALAALVGAAILPHARYDHVRLLAHRQAVRELFEIPWTGITPRMQRLLYAINAIAQPANMIAVGIFCGNTFISNAGAAVGPGACYQARNLVGVEIKPAEAERAERNVRRIDPTGVARVVAGDAVGFVAAFREPIHLLYLDADGTDGRGKGVYLDIVRAGYDRMPAGSLVLAHNSVNCADRLSAYLAFVRDPAQWTQCVIFFGLLAFYFFNLRGLRYQSHPNWRNFTSFLNLSASALVLATLITRFIFPLLSLEGRRFWILGLLPVQRSVILRGKFYFAVVASSVVLGTLITLSSVMLKLEQQFILLHVYTAILLCFGLSGLSVGLSALYPNLREDNPAKIVSGFGGTLTLIASLIYVLLIILLEAVPCHLYLAKGVISSRTFAVWIAVALVFATALSAAVCIVPMWRGVRALEQREF